MRERLLKESAVGRGSTFWFTVRLQKQSAGGTTLVRREDVFARQRVLVVDDNQTNCKVLHHCLRSWGLESDCVAGGPEARAATSPGAEDAAPVYRSGYGTPPRQPRQRPPDPPARRQTHDLGPRSAPRPTGAVRNGGGAPYGSGVWRSVPP